MALIVKLDRLMDKGIIEIDLWIDSFKELDCIMQVL